MNSFPFFVVLYVLGTALMYIMSRKNVVNVSDTIFTLLFWPAAALVRACIFLVEGNLWRDLGD